MEIARQKALISKNVFAAWHGAGLYPFNQQKVLRHLPTSSRPTTPTTPTQATICLPHLSISPLDREALKQSTTEFKLKVFQGLPLSSPSQRYAVGLAGIAENLATQVSILDKHNKMQEAILNNPTENRSGKRMVIKGHFALSTKEILEKVRKAERETTSQRKAKGKATQRGKNRK
ncbi:MAG: hypothetical protein M1840_005349 [Geoglossum simile]|nr:MAG: hypothetical protein M1840_005349 [Geoglossum simile]